MDGTVYALDMQNGSILWTTNIRTHKVIQSPQWGHRLVSSPAYADGQLYVGSDDGRLYCLNASNGKILWEVRIGFGLLGVYGSVTYHDGKIFAGNGDTWKWDGNPKFPGFLSAIAADTGKIVWRHFFLRGGTGSAPAVHNGRVFIGALDHHLYAFDENNGRVVWRYTMSDAVWCSPSVADGMVFIADMDGFVYAVNESTGKEVWKFHGGQWSCCSTPTVYDQKVYFGLYTEKGSTFPYGALYCLDEYTGLELRSVHLSHICPPPIIADDMIFYGSHDYFIYARNVSDLSEVWKHQTGDVVQGEGALVDGHFFIGSNDGYLYCFGNNTFRQ
jgi:outer membrane protein assembly factor BamB